MAHLSILLDSYGSVGRLYLPSINRLIKRLKNRLIRVGLGITMCIITAWCYLLILPSVTKLANIRQIILENQRD